MRSKRFSHSLSLQALLPQARFAIAGTGDVRVAACCRDSRRVERGDVFVAIVGASEDGHCHAREAVRRGAAAVLAERPVASEGAPVALVDNTAAAYAQLCQAFAGHPARDLAVIGVTGTNGKTTTTSLIAAILDAAGRRVGLSGTLGNCDSEISWPNPLTTPGAEALADWLDRCRVHDCSHAVLEVSSHGLSQARIAGIPLAVACITNVTSDHLDYHGSLANYRQVKRRMLDSLAPAGLAIINSDDPICRSWLADIECPTLTIGMQSSADVTARLLEAHLSEQSFVITAGSESIVVRTAMIGEHHIYNCLIATAAGLSMEIDLPTIVRGLENITAMPGRLERIECGQPFGVFVDYAHTPDALQRSLSTLRQVTAGRLICVYGAGGDRDRKKRPVMGRVVEQYTDAGIITNDNPRREPPEQIIEEILGGYFRPEQAIIEPDRASAIGAALNAAEPGDCVLIAGKGHETIQEIGDQRLDFDDRDVARGWLYAAESVDAMIGQSRRRN